MTSYFYVIGPVGADPVFDEKRNILIEVGSDHEVGPLFPLDRHSAFSPEEAVRDMRGAEIVIADLSHERPSCYYELGLAEAAGVSITLIAEAGTRIHQVGNPRSVRFYADLADYRRMMNEIFTKCRRTAAG